MLPNHRISTLCDGVVEGSSEGPAFGMMVRKIFILFDRWLECVFFSAFPLSAYDVFLLYVEAGTMGYRIESEVYLQPNENWCCCCSPSQTYGRKWGDSNFQILTELPVPPQAAGVVGTF